MLVVLREIITEHDPCKAVVFLAFSQGPAAAALVRDTAKGGRVSNCLSVLQQPREASKQTSLLRLLAAFPLHVHKSMKQGKIFDGKRWEQWCWQRPGGAP